ncbi:MAG TPA: hypothetical protein QGF63_20270 [Alphaproteobacteria bacterium]|jgi:hypothetical protein|nr:hypothetical protein [Alphaproteobacteria bacterium]HJM52157.1 hypothetical protein [Alphaproteobacteria bacterium]|tara:strand:+ start:416 stop:586 length:171 start_codon:yes stop_codon:yes gene_type:complete
MYAMLSAILQEPPPDASLNEWLEFLHQLDDLSNDGAVAGLRADAEKMILELEGRAA